MSTFGKKSLVWWDYKNHARDNVRRFTFTPKDFQLKILQKWYPIGMTMYEHTYSKTNYYKIVDYVETLGCYNLKLERLEFTKFDSQYKNINPLMIEPIESDMVQIKRDYKIKRLLE